MPSKTFSIRGALPILAAGLVLRALIPAGYMPGSLESGFWFELCGEGLPAGFSQQSAGIAHHHHAADQGDSVADSSLSGDCSFAHLLAGAVVATDAALLPVDRYRPALIAYPRPRAATAAVLLRPPARAPPALH